MTSPYINTELSTHVSLYPNQMDNKLYINLKKNLEAKLGKKCYSDNGYIMEIYKIVEYKDGNVEAENPSGSAIFDVKFSCRLCIPLRGKQIICKVDRANKVLITVANGPIVVIVTNERINNKIFFMDNYNNLRFKKEDKSHILEPNEFVKVTLLSITFNNGDNKIKAIGYLDDIATEKEKENFYLDLYNTDKETIDLEKYKEENMIQEG